MNDGNSEGTRERRWTWRLAPLPSGMLVGTSAGALIVLLGAAVMWGRINAQSGELAPSMVSEVVRAALGILAVVAVFHLALGALIGAAASWMLPSLPPSGRWRLVPLVFALWGVLLVQALAAAPGTLARFRGVHDLPFWAILGVGAAGVVVLLAVARAPVRRVVPAIALLLVPAILPTRAVRVPAADDEAVPSVVLVGIDNLRRDAILELGQRLAASPERYGGRIRVVRDAVSPVAITRVAWQSILTGQPADSLIPVDTLTPEGWRARYASVPFLLTREVRAVGGRSVYVTDDALTNVFLPGEPFDRVVVDAAGWRVEVARRFRRAFPLLDLWVGRHVGVGLANTPGNGSSARVLSRMASELRRGGRLVAGHAVSLHGEIEPTLAEVGGLTGLLRLRPRDLATLRITEHAGEAGVDARPAAMPQIALYERRQVRALDDVEAFVAGLQRAGHRRRNLVIIFSDHGDYFPEEVSENVPDLHGTELEPSGALVGALVLLPTDEGREGVREIQGTFALHEIGGVAAAFLHGRRAGTGGAVTLARIERGDSLPVRFVAARSFGRVDIGARGLSDRPSFRWRDVKGGMRFWPDGRMSTAPATLALMTATADIGRTDGRTLVACRPDREGDRVVISTWEEGRLQQRARIDGSAGIAAAEQACGGLVRPTAAGTMAAVPSAAGEGEGGPVHAAGASSAAAAHEGSGIEDR